MALNNDFRVKNSLYVGNSACFVSQLDTPTILSAGNSLFDIFLQEGEGGAGILSDGDGITDFMFDNLSAATVAVDGTVVRTTGGQTIGPATTNFQNNICVGGKIYSGSDANTLIEFGNGTLDIKTGSENHISLSNTGVVINEPGNSNDFRVEGDTDTHALFVDGSTDNVGIGTSTPGAKLTVNGGTCTTGLSATAANSGILSAGKDLNEIFQIIGSDARGKVLSDGIGIQDFTYEGLSAQTVAVSQSILSGGASHVQGTLTLSGAGGTGYNTTIDLGLQAADNPTFAGVTGGNVRVGITADGEIDTSSGNLTIDSAGGTTILDDANISIANVGAGTDNTVVIKSGSNLATDEIDPKVWDIKLVDYTSLFQYHIPLAADSTGTLANSKMIQKAAGGGFDVTGINVLGGLSALSLSGNGAGLTALTAAPIFPPTPVTNIASANKFFINDGANKYVTFGNLLTDLAGTGLAVEGSDSLTLKNSAGFSNCKLQKWDDGNGQFVNSIITETALGNISIAGGATITGNLSVQGDVTCIDTTYSITSALSVVNAGTGPAIFARQTGTDEPIARFVDTEGGFITFDDGGNVGIGIDSPTEKLDVVGNIKASGGLTINGDSTLGNTSGDTVTINGAVITVPNLAAGTQSGNKVLARDSSNRIILDDVDSKIFGTLLVDGEGSANKLTKYTNGTGTIGDSSITDSASLVTIDSNTKIDEGHDLVIAADAVTGDTAFGSCTKKATFSTVVTSASSHALPTFTKTNLKQAKYNVTLVKGVNVTAFEVQAVYNNSTTCGTVYGIVDAQNATQLNTVTISNGGSTIDLSIKSTSAGTCAIVTGEALYLA